MRLSHSPLGTFTKRWAKPHGEPSRKDGGANVWSPPGPFGEEVLACSRGRSWDQRRALPAAAGRHRSPSRLLRIDPAPKTHVKPATGQQNAPGSPVSFCLLHSMNFTPKTSNSD